MERLQLLGAECRDDQEHDVGAGRPRFEQLILGR